MTEGCHNYHKFCLWCQLDGNPMKSWSKVLQKATYVLSQHHTCNVSHIVRIPVLRKQRMEMGECKLLDLSGHINPRQREVSKAHDNVLQNLLQAPTRETPDMLLGPKTG